MSRMKNYIVETVEVRRVYRIVRASREDVAINRAHKGAGPHILDEHQVVIKRPGTTAIAEETDDRWNRIVQMGDKA